MAISSLIASDKSTSDITTGKSHSLRNGIFCALVYLSCFWVAWPVSQISLMDGWSYTKTAEVFAHTGHIAYNGWAGAIVGWMILWGAAFIKLFGFSFMVVKLSTLPLAVATLLLFHAILRRFAITPRNAVIGTLTLGLSPLFLPLSASFMTDVPALFVMMLCLYCCQRAVLGESDRTAIAWLVVAAVFNVMGGTARQVAWLGVLVMVPCTGWLMRRRRRVLVTVALLWLAGIGAVFYCMHWFARQPYSIRVRIFPKVPGSVLEGVIHSLIAIDLMGSLVLGLLLVVFPVLVAWPPRFPFAKGIHRSIQLIGGSVLGLLALRALWGSSAGIWPPWLLFKELSTMKEVDGGWHFDALRSLVPVSIQLLITLLVVSAAFGCMVIVYRRRREITSSDDAQLAQRLFWLLVPFSVCYFLLLIPLAFQRLSFGRYTLGVMPCAIIGCIWLYQRCVAPVLPARTVGVLVVYAMFAVAGTHDIFAWQRARMAAIQEIRSSGIPRTGIEGGFVYDSWTQVTDSGYVNDPRITNPKNAYHPLPEQPKPSKNGCKQGYTVEYPVLHPRFAVGFGPQWCYLPSKFAAVPYTAWLPPFRRTVEVQKIPRKGK